MIWSLRYLTYTRSDIVLEVGLISRFMKSPYFSNLKGVKCILLYIRSMSIDGVFYVYANKIEFDSDWIDDLEK